MATTERDRINQLIKRYNKGLETRRYFEQNLWEPAREFCAPQEPSMLSTSQLTAQVRGEKRGAKAYDGTPLWARGVLVNGLVSGLIPEGFKWFQWRLKPTGLNEDAGVKAWIEECVNITNGIIGDTNYNEVSAVTFDMEAVYGTGTKYTEYNASKFLAFQNLKLTDCVIFEGKDGRVDTLFRECRWSARLWDKEWGKRCPTYIKAAVESGNVDEEFPFYHFVLPREEYDPSKRDRRNMPWASLWIDPREKMLMDEGGYVVFPHSVPRWWRPVGEGPWGRGPAIQALQDMGVLNQMERTNMIGAHRMVEPALAIPNDGFNKALDLGPNGHNYYNPTKGGISPINMPPGLPFAVEMQDRKAKAVARHFYTDVFLMLSDALADAPNRTATEVLERKQEKLQVLGPTLGRQRQEHLDSDLDIIFHLLMSNGHLPPPPDIVLEYGEKIETEYLSPLSIAQRRIDVDTTMRVYQSASVMTQLTGRTDAIDCLNDEEAVRLIADREAAPTKIIRSREEVEAMRRQKAEEAQAMKDAQMALAATQGAKDLGSIETGPDKPNLLTDVVNSAQGAQ